MFHEEYPFPLILLEETVSTNQYLTELCDKKGAEVAEYTTVIARNQTAGKGQRGNSWESEPGMNLLCSFVIYPDFLEARQQFLLSQIVSLSIQEMLLDEILGVTVKWPNDIYWNKRKICGILIENDLQGHNIGRCIVGFGLNLNQEIFRSDAPNPISLHNITGYKYHIDWAINKIMKRFSHYYEQLRTGDFDVVSKEINERYDYALFRRTGMHKYRNANGEFMAEIVRVEPDGRFVLRDEDGKEREYLFKEVEYVL